MSSKLTRTLDSIAQHPEMVQDAWKSSNEYYFRFNGHTFSIATRSDPDEPFGRYSFFVYPDWQASTEELANAFDYEGTDGIKVAAYHSADCEESSSFHRLYTVVEQAYLHVDEIFDDIIRLTSEE